MVLGLGQRGLALLGKSAESLRVKQMGTRAEDHGDCARLGDPAILRSLSYPPRGLANAQLS